MGKQYIRYPMNLYDGKLQSVEVKNHLEHEISLQSYYFLFNNLIYHLSDINFSFKTIFQVQRVGGRYLVILATFITEGLKLWRTKCSLKS